MAMPGINSLSALLRHRAVIALADQAAVSVASFGTGILLSRAFAGALREQLGLYYLAVTIGILIVEIQNALVSTPLTVTAPTLQPAPLCRFIGSSLIHHVVLSLVVTMLLALAGLFAPLLGIASHRGMLLACSITAGAVALRNFARFLNFALHRPHIACVSDWIITLLQLSGIVWLQRINRLSASSAVLIIGLSSLIGGMLALFLSRQFIQSRLSRAWPDFRSNWRLSRWVFASGIIGNAGVSLYPWILDRFSDILQAAVWGNCNTVSSAGNPVLMGLQNWMAPAVAHAFTDRPRAEFRRYVTKLAGVFLLILPPMLLGLGLISRLLLHRVYRDFTPQTTWLVLLLAAGSLFQAVGFIFTRGLFSLGRGATDVWTNVIPLVVLIAAGLPLVMRYGAIGGAVSLLAALLISSAVRGLLFWRLCCADENPTAGAFASADPVMQMEVAQ
jgi:O-antigen/teichoic acid export membrane protein